MCRAGARCTVQVHLRGLRAQCNPPHWSVLRFPQGAGRATVLDLRARDVFEGGEGGGTMAFVTDNNCPQPIWQSPPTAYLTASWKGRDLQSPSPSTATLLRWVPGCGSIAHPPPPGLFLAHLRGRWTADGSATQGRPAAGPVHTVCLSACEPSDPTSKCGRICARRAYRPGFCLRPSAQDMPLASGRDSGSR